MTTEPARPAEVYRGRWAALALLLTAVFMDMVDNQIVNIALPTSSATCTRGPRCCIGPPPATPWPSPSR